MVSLLRLSACAYRYPFMDYTRPGLLDWFVPWLRFLALSSADLSITFFRLLASFVYRAILTDTTRPRELLRFTTAILLPTLRGLVLDTLPSSYPAGFLRMDECDLSMTAEADLFDFFTVAGLRSSCIAFLNSSF